MASPKAKFDPLESAKLGTDAPAQVAAVLTVPGGAPAPRKFPVAPDDPASAPRVRFRVTKATRVAMGGGIVDFRVGAELDPAGYDVERLRAHGVELERVEG